MSAYDFTDGVRYSLQVAREEADALDHEYVGTEHILLGLLRTEGIPITVLSTLGVSVAELRLSVLAVLKRGRPGHNMGPDLPYTTRAKKVLDEAMAEARDLHHSHVGTEHLLLGLIRERKGVAALTLAGYGLTEQGVRAETVRVLGSATGGGKAESPPPRKAPVSNRPTSFLIVAEASDGQLSAQRFKKVEDAIGFLELWRGAP